LPAGQKTGWQLDPGRRFESPVLGPIDYTVWFVTFVAEVIALFYILRAKVLSRHFTLAFYLFCCIASNLGRYLILSSSGYYSAAYKYFYYLSDALLTICLYFVLMGLYSEVFTELGVNQTLRAGAMLLLAGTSGISYYLVSASNGRLLTQFVIELSRNLYFVGLLLTYVLWATMLKMQENRTRLLQLVLSMGVYFSAFAASFALASAYPDFAIWRIISRSMELWLPLSWAYTFTKVRDDARLTTASVLATTR
jgi:hypothetical protein